jgi:hypothetical protein
MSTSLSKGPVSCEWDAIARQVSHVVHELDDRGIAVRLQAESRYLPLSY